LEIYSILQNDDAAVAARQKMFAHSVKETEGENKDLFNADQEIENNNNIGQKNISKIDHSEKDIEV